MTQPILHESNGKRWLLVEVPEGAYCISVTKPDQYFHINYKLPDENGLENSGGFAIFYKAFGSKTKYPKQIQILGPSTADKLTEEQAAEMVGCWKGELRTTYEDYGKTYRNYGYLSALSSFASLLRYHGLGAATTVVLGEII